MDLAMGDSVDWVGGGTTNQTDSDFQKWVLLHSYAIKHEYVSVGDEGSEF